MNAIRRIAMSDAVSPIASIFLSPSLSLMKPENSLPAVIPQKSTPADTAARPSEKPLASTRNVADHIMAVFSIEQYAKKARIAGITAPLQNLLYSGTGAVVSPFSAFSAFFHRGSEAKSIMQMMNCTVLSIL